VDHGASGNGEPSELLGKHKEGRQRDVYKVDGSGVILMRKWELSWLLEEGEGIIDNLRNYARANFMMIIITHSYIHWASKMADRKGDTAWQPIRPYTGSFCQARAS
jgi:hypothetical protein